MRHQDKWKLEAEEPSEPSTPVHWGAIRARDVLEHYDADCVPSTRASYMAKLVADLMHLCEVSDVDFNDVLKKASLHHLSEVEASTLGTAGPGLTVDERDECSRYNRVGRQLGDPFVLGPAMVLVPVKVSLYEMKLIMKQWLELLHAHNQMRADDNHSIRDLNDDCYAIDRCTALIDAGLVTQEEFEALRAAVFGGPMHSLEVRQQEEEAARRKKIEGSIPF